MDEICRGLQGFVEAHIQKWYQFVLVDASQDLFYQLPGLFCFSVTYTGDCALGQICCARRRQWTCVS